MSSLRNAVQRRNHRERAQPVERQKWGLLEKRKDYKLRAADHKTKQRKIKALKQKASERNEDEFYYGMMNASTDGGIKKSKRGDDESSGGGKTLGLDVVKLMKTQDRGYLQTMLQKTRFERERLEREVIAADVGVMVSPGSRSGKVVFTDDGTDKMPHPAPAVRDHGDLDIDIDLLCDGESDGGGAQEDLDNEDIPPEERAARERKQHSLGVKSRKVRALKEQEEKLSSALNQVDWQRAKMNGTVGGVNKSGTRFKIRQRKR